VASFSAEKVNAANAADREIIAVGNVVINLVQDSRKQVVVGDKSYTYEELANAFSAMCYVEWRRAHKPVFRQQGLREKGTAP
jgi:hypothetical protein